MRFGLDIAQQRVTWDELVSRVQFAEELGFDGAWGFDHFQPMYGDGPGETFEGMTLERCLAAFAPRFELQAREPVPGGGRVLLLFRKRRPAAVA